jgi:C-terminal peptidase prc
MRILLLLAALCGCARVPMARPDQSQLARASAPPPGTALVYVYRPSGMMGTAITLRVFFDEAWVGELASGTFAEILARPGEHKVVVRATGSAERTLVAEEGRTYFVKVTPRWGRHGANVGLELVTDERVAREELRRTSLIAGFAAGAIRDIAAGMANVVVDPVPPYTLVNVATRAIAELGGGGAVEAPDLESAIAALRAANPAVNETQLVLAATRAMVASLRRAPAPDPGTADRAVDWSAGLVVARRDGGVRVETVVADSPAALAGVEPGLEIVEVDGKPARDRGPSEIVQMLSGPAGSDVALTLRPPGGADRRVALRRGTVSRDAVDCRVVAGRVLYLKPWGIQPANARRIRDLARGPEAPRLVVLDLRDNTGGSAGGAQDLVDSFLAGGRVVSVAGARLPGVDEAHDASAGTSSLEEARVVVLVNERTSGAAEAVAAAVQDHRRGPVVGSTTAGYGAVTSEHTFRGVTVTLPVARLVRPSGALIDGAGVVPDLDGVAPPAAGAGAPSDVACAGVASVGSVAADPLVGRAVGFLLAGPERG